MKSGKASTIKAVALGVAVMFVAASCGSGGTSNNGKSKNAALCFETQEDKDAAILAAQTALDAANASDTTGASGGYRVPAVRSMSGGTTVPPNTTNSSAGTTVPSSNTTQDAPSSDTTVPSSDTTVPSSDSTDVSTDETVVDSEPNIAMLEQALADAENQPLCDEVSDTTIPEEEEANMESELVWSEWGTIFDVTPITSFSLTIPAGGGVIEIFTHTKTADLEIGETQEDCGTNLADSWIIIVDADNNLIAQDDDSGMGMEPCSFWASYLNKQVEEGVYTILATNFGQATNQYWPWDMAFDLDYRFGAQVSTEVTIDTIPSTDDTTVTDDTTAGSSLAPSSTDSVQSPVVTVPLPVVVRLVENVPMPVIEQLSLPVQEIILEKQVVIETETSSMICDADCILEMFEAADLETGTLTINGVTVSSDSTGMKVPVRGKQGKITAVVASTDGTPVLELSTDFERLVVNAPAEESTTAETSTSGSSMSIYIYVLIALLILLAIWYNQRRKKAKQSI